MENDLYAHIGRMYVQITKFQEHFEQLKEILKQKDKELEELREAKNKDGTE